MLHLLGRVERAKGSQGDRAAPRCPAAHLNLGPGVSRKAAVLSVVLGFGQGECGAEAGGPGAGSCPGGTNGTLVPTMQSGLSGDPHVPTACSQASSRSHPPRPPSRCPLSVTFIHLG